MINHVETWSGTLLGCVLCFTAQELIRISSRYHISVHISTRAPRGGHAHGPSGQGAGKGFLVGVGYDMVMVGQYNHIMSGWGSCGALVSLVWLILST